MNSFCWLLLTAGLLAVASCLLPNVYTPLCETPPARALFCEKRSPNKCGERPTRRHKNRDQVNDMSPGMRRLLIVRLLIALFCFVFSDSFRNEAFRSVGTTTGPLIFPTTSDNNFTAIALLDGISVPGSVAYKQYKYYQFPYRYPSENPFDPKDPLKFSIQFDLQSQSGDADLLVSCFFRPTGDENGIPSRAIGHYNFSSQRYDEDEISITADYPHNCALPGKAAVYTLISSPLYSLPSIKQLSIC
jgi:hypothetical protein